MTARIDIEHASPVALKAMYALQAAVNHSGLEPSLNELVKLRASQINGCAYCVDMHSKDMKAHGETDERINLLCVWREAPHYTPRERAALLWTETLTRIADNGVPDDIFDEVHKEFDEEELANLTLALVAINGWNRFMVSFRPEVGTYQPPVGAAKTVKAAAVKATAMG
jgi:AhpD family alkylhydroperoxidase